MVVKHTVAHAIPYAYSLLPSIIWVLSSFAWYRQYEEPFLVGLFVVTFGFSISVFLHKEQSKIQNRTFFGVLLFTLLTLVLNTGWFYSPFLFVLYLAAIAIALLYSFVSSTMFLVGLCIFFIQYVQPNNPWYDIMRICALFTALPLSIHFSSEFLRLKQSARHILILKDERDHYLSELERLRKNELVWNNVLLRQSLATTRNYALYWKNHSDKFPPKLRRDLGRMSDKLDEMLKTIKEFEQEHLDGTYL